jgi:hydrogenase maturation factor
MAGSARPALLQKKNPKDIKTGRRRHKHFQFFTHDIAIPPLDKLLAVTITLMKISANWRKFINLFNRAVPKSGTQQELEFMHDFEEE